MAKRMPCDNCGKTHTTFSGLDRCAQKQIKSECICPRYWRRRWPSHSQSHGCPLVGQTREIETEDEDATEES